MKDFIPKLLENKYSEIISETIKKVNIFLNINKKLFQERIESGFVRDCHGDLHSGNIFLYKDPVIFDCIEFNNIYRKIDILDEISFLCMDLEFMKKTNLSRKLLYYYFQYAGYSLGPNEKLLHNYYKCYRANIRAKVIAIQATQSKKGSLTHKNLLKKVEKYLLLMKKYSLKI